MVYVKGNIFVLPEDAWKAVRSCELTLLFVIPPAEPELGLHGHLN